jgi:hypothetical protein
MRAMIAWWELDRSAQTIDSLREFLADEAIPAWRATPGLVHKFWIADRETNRWGAVMIWASAEAAKGPLPTRAVELIGYPPALREWFDVEATLE